MAAVSVFVSSTFSDLEKFREAVRSTIRRLGATDVAMESFGSRDARPLNECQRIIRAESDIFVGLYARRYGFVPRGQKRSITFSEYEAARKARLPILAYLLDDRARWPARLIDRGDASKRLADFRSDLKNRHIVSFFTRAEELAAMVAADLGRHLSQDRQRVARLRTLSGESRAREQRLLDALRTGDRAERERAASALSSLLSAASVPTLVQLMLGPDEELADIAVKALQWNVAVGEGLLSPHAEVRYWAAFRIGENALQNHERGLEHVTALVKLLARKSDPIGVMQQAAHSLAKIGGRTAMKHLLELIEQPGTPPEVVLTAIASPTRFWTDGMFASSASYHLVPTFRAKALAIIDDWPPEACARIASHRSFADLHHVFQSRITARCDVYGAVTSAGAGAKSR